MVCGRTLDWETSDVPRLWVIPRGIERCGGTEPGAATWASRYGSVSMQGWGVATTEAVNEAGLSARGLYLKATEWEPADDRPAISNLMWTQYAADNDATVEEALPAPNVVWLELDKLSLSAGDEVRSVDPRDPQLAGAIDRQLAPAVLDWGVG